MTETEIKTCGHRITEAPPDMCENCKTRQCDDCAEDNVVCSCCGGGICTACESTARKRYVSDIHALGRSRHEYLCAPCATKQDAARETLALALRETDTSATFGSMWLSDIIADLEKAIGEAKEEL